LTLVERKTVSSLDEFITHLQNAQRAHSSMKVYFYGLEGPSQLRTGFVNIWGGVNCELSLLNLPKKEALIALQKLKINRVMSIPVAGNSVVAQAGSAFNLQALIDALNGLSPSPLAAVAATTASDANANSAQQLTASARAVLSRFLGASADRIVREAAEKAPPAARPSDFLQLLQTELAMMLGAAAAAQQLTPIAQQFNLKLK
jgi:hypothetical protein